MRVNHLSDQELVNLCLSRTATDQAWRQLWDRCHAHLLRVVRHELGREAADEDSVREVVQDLWCTLYEMKQKLLGPFDSTRGTIQAYLAKLARRQAHWGYQHRRRSRKRECGLWEVPENRLAFIEFPQGVILDEFAKILTPAEHDFFIYDLRGEARPRHCPTHSESYGRVFTKRIFDKWRSWELGRSSDLK